MATTTALRSRFAATVALTVAAALGVGSDAASAQPPTRDGGEQRSSGRIRDAALFWSAAAGRAATAACIAPLDNPLHESRMYAMAHLAIHDAVNAIDPRYQRYASWPQVRRPVSAEAAVAAAAKDVLTATIREIPQPFPQECRDAGTSSVETDYTTAVAKLPPSSAVTQGFDVGHAAAAAVLAKRTGDGSDTPLVVTDFPQGTTPGVWRFTPDLPFAFAPGGDRCGPSHCATQHSSAAGLRSR